MLFVFPGLVHVGDELREVNGNLITHKRPDEISQILVKDKKKSIIQVQILYDYSLMIPVVALDDDAALTFFSPSHKAPSH